MIMYLYCPSSRNEIMDVSRTGHTKLSLRSEIYDWIAFPKQRGQRSACLSAVDAAKSNGV